VSFVVFGIWGSWNIRNGIFFRFSSWVLALYDLSKFFDRPISNPTSFDNLLSLIYINACGAFILFHLVYEKTSNIKAAQI
jgi:hypothetical protein